MNKRGFMKMSFGMIFSIILIIAFLALAFYGIKQFLEMKDEAEIESFKENIQKDVKGVWNEFGSSNRVENYPMNLIVINLERICINQSERYDKNMFLYYKGESIPERSKINHVNMEESSGSCFSIENGEIKVRMKKGSDDNKVTLKPAE